jgi:peptidyl-Lys metalloendopeptidase
MRTQRFLLALLPMTLTHRVHAIRSSRKDVTDTNAELSNEPPKKSFANRPAVFRKASANKMTFDLQATTETTISLSATGPVRFSSYYTPFYGEQRGQVEDMFQITPPAKFVGALANYAYDFVATAIHLSRGQTKSITLDLSLLYAFQPGTTYAVQFSRNVYFLKEQAWLPVESNQVNISISTQTKMLVDHKLAKAYLPSGAAKLLPIKQNATQTVTTYSCSPSERGTIRSALKNAQRKSTVGRSCFDASSNATTFSDLIIRWFGQAAWDTGLYSTLQTKLTAIQFGLNDVSINVACNPNQCQSDVYSYVIPSDSSHTINMCHQFFIGIKYERTNTFAHEMSHFTNVASTIDAAYGPTNCLSLAVSQPDGAVGNADSYGYFVAESYANLC